LRAANQSTWQGRRNATQVRPEERKFWGETDLPSVWEARKERSKAFEIRAAVESLPLGRGKKGT